MGQYQIRKLRDCPEWKEPAASWFHEKWDIPKEEYQESIETCIRRETAVPQWYLVIEDGRILGGAGVIENDFHRRKDLSPNLCALYVEEAYRKQGIAGKLLDYIEKDMEQMGVSPLYLITDHTSFYERYGWRFLCMTQEEDGQAWVRLYVYEEGESV